MRKRQKNIPNFLKMRPFLSKLANNSAILTKVVSPWENRGHSSVFLLNFSHNLCQCRLHDIYISDQSLLGYKKHLSILTLNLAVFVPKMVKIKFFETNVEFVPKTFLQIAIIKERTSLGWWLA